MEEDDHDGIEATKYDIASNVPGEDAGWHRIILGVSGEMDQPELINKMASATPL